ncbi:phage integrase family protein [Burkholderia pseudomallei]|nr:phage integrase family protein [Burkholderia pseudomallei]
MDEGQLRPLPQDEVLHLIRILHELNNVEMTLIFLGLILGCARVQSFLTLRYKHVKDEWPSQKEVKIPAGPGTGIDTKKGKGALLCLPKWFYESLRTYALSERAAKRRARCSFSVDNPYLFLTNRGNPYYLSKADRIKFNSNPHPPQPFNGTTVRTFLGRCVLPKMKEVFGKDYRMRLHDLKATGGLIFLEGQLELVERKEITLAKARDRLRERLWHDHQETTDRYMDYKRLKNFYVDVQQEYEGHLMQLIRKAADGIDDSIY